MAAAASARLHVSLHARLPAQSAIRAVRMSQTDKIAFAVRGKGLLWFP